MESFETFHGDTNEHLEHAYDVFVALYDVLDDENIKINKIDENILKESHHLIVV